MQKIYIKPLLLYNMDLIKFEQTFDAYNNYMASSNKRDLKQLKDQDKPTFNEFKIILKALIRELIFVKGDKNHLKSMIEGISAKGKKAKDMLKFLDEIDKPIKKVKEDYVLLAA